MLPIMASVCLACIGSAMLTTAVSFYLGKPGIAPDIMQIVLTAYPVGFLIGCLITRPLVVRYGHERTFLLILTTALLSAAGFVFTDFVPSWFCFRLLGGNFMASEITRELTSVVLYPITVVVVLRFFIKDWLRVAAWSAIIMAASIALRITSVLIAVNSLLGIRSTIPVLLLAGNVSLSHIVQQQASSAWNVLLCTIAFFIFMVGIPFVYNIYLSLSDYTFGGSETFVGLENFRRLADPDDYHFPVFWNGLWNTVIFVLLSTPMLVIGGLFLAIVVNGKYRGRNAFRAIFFLPWTLGIAVVGLLWWWIFNGSFGLLTNFLSSWGIVSPTWLTTNPWAWFSILLATLWWTVGFNTIVLLAGLQSIAVDLYEAAAIDGANRWQQFRYITVPSLRPILLLVITLQVISSFNLVGQPQIITSGGPPTAQTTPVLLHLYNVGFKSPFDVGLAAAMAVIVAIVMVVVSVINFRFFSSERA